MIGWSLRNFKAHCSVVPRKKVKKIEKKVKCRSVPIQKPSLVSYKKMAFKHILNALKISIGLYVL